MNSVCVAGGRLREWIKRGEGGWSGGKVGSGRRWVWTRTLASTSQGAASALWLRQPCLSPGELLRPRLRAGQQAGQEDPSRILMSHLSLQLLQLH